LDLAVVAGSRIGRILPSRLAGSEREVAEEAAVGWVCCFAASQIGVFVGTAAAAAVAAEEFVDAADVAAAAAVEACCFEVRHIAVIVADPSVASVAAAVEAYCFEGTAAEAGWHSGEFLAAAEAEPAVVVAEEAFVVAAGQECLPVVSVLVAAVVEKTEAALANAATAPS
jgi:hypothetical protein